MPWSALPPHINEPHEWAGTDHDTKWTRWMLYIKGWTAFGPRAKETWARWREFPKTLFAIRAKEGVFRLERESWERDSSWEDWLNRTSLVNENIKVVSWPDGKEKAAGNALIEDGYLSRCQKYTRWSFQIQWPLMVAFHFYTRAEDVPKWGDPTPSGFADGKIWFFYLGAHRDADKVYMFPSAYLGRNWK